MKTMNLIPHRLAVLLGLGCALSLSALADQTWKGTSDNLWSTTLNWSGGAAPLSTDNVVYNGTSTANLSNWLGSTYTIAGILFTNPAGPVSISGSALTINGGGINMSNATQNLTLAAPIALGASNTWVVNANQTLLVSGLLSGAGANGIYKDGFGTLYLSGANTFTGGFTDNGGQVWINNSAALGAGGSTRNITVANNSVGAGLHLNGTNGNISLPNILQFILSQNQGTVFNEAGDNVIPGNIYVTSGGGDCYFVVNAGTLTLKGPVQSNAGARGFQLGGAGNGTNNGAISTALSLRKMDGGIWTVTNNNTYTGATTVEGGTLVLAATAKIGSTPSITVFNNATLDVSAVMTSGTNAFALTTGQMLAGGGNVMGNVNASAAGVLIQPGSLNVHSLTGGMGAAGTLSISGNLSLGPTTTNYFELGSSTTVGGGINDLVSVGGDLDPQNAYISISTFTGLVNGTYRLFNYSGAKLSSFNPTCASATYRGTFTIDETVPGQVNLIVSGVVNPVWAGTGSSSAWDLNSTADWNANTSTFFNGDSVTFDDTGTAPTANISGTLQPGSVTFNNSTVNYTLALSSGKITGPCGLTKSGSGTLTISATTSDFTGPVTINGGILSVGSMAANGSASTLGAGTSVALNGGTFQFTGARPAAGVVNRFWTLGPNGGTVQSTTATFFLANTISGPGSFTKAGSQQIILGDLTAGLLTAANNAYSGNTYVTQGEVQIRNAHALGFGKAVVSAGADLAVGGQANYGTVTNDIDLYGYDSGGLGALVIGDNNTGINFGGTITLLGNSSVGSKSGASGLTFNISGPIVGSGSLTKLQSSAVTVTLGGNNTYSGNTIITGGTLAVGIGGVGSVSNTPSISVAAGAKLQLNSGALLGSTVNISLAAGGYFDVNGLGAGTTYTLGSGATLNAAGTGTTSGSTQAEIHGNGTGTVSLGSRPISLTFTPSGFSGDTTHPALVISQGQLQLNGNVITINNAAGTALGVGIYRVIQVASGSTSGTPNATPFITGKGLAANMTAVLSVSSGNVILTVSSTSPTATGTTITSLSGSSYGSSVTFTATVAPIPTAGTMQFYDNGVAIGIPVTVGGDGTASLTTSTLWAGSHSITAAYSGTTGYGPSATASASSQVVSAVPLTITANDDSKSYGQSRADGARSRAFTTSALQNGDVITSVALTSSGDAATAAAGSYNLTPSGPVGPAFNANNYTITYNNGTLTVNPAALSITANADTKIYGQTKTYGAGSTGFTRSGLQNGETIGFVTITAGNSGGLAPAPVGPYTLTPSAATGGTFTPGNYTITYNPGTLTVSAAALAITANSATKECSQSLTFAGTEFTTGAGQLVNGDTVTNITLTCAGAASGSATGSYDIVPSAAEGTGLSNYNLAYHNGTLTVQDTTPPTIIYYFTNLTLSTTSSNCQALLPDLTGTNYIIAVDGCSSSVTVTQDPPADTWLPLGTNIVVLTALDASTNAAYSTNTVVVVDATAPVILCSADISVVTTDPVGAAVTFSVSATDNCDPSPAIVSIPASGSFFAAGTNTVTSYTTDSSGNSNSCSFQVIVDRAPVVQSSVSGSLVENQSLTLPFDQLLAAVTDPDSDPLTVTNAGPTSTNGASVTLTETGVTYTPLPDFVGNDLFSYTVTDSRGGFATNVVYLTVTSSSVPPPDVVYGPVVSNGLFIVRFAGVPGSTYTVEATDQLSPSAWSKQTNLTAPTTDQGLGVGVFEFSQSTSEATNRFYRTVYPSY
jgi:autotransporter-associated beta strand protein